MYQRTLHIILLFILPGTPLLSRAQNPPYSIPGYSVNHYTDENGLPQNSVKGICMDNEGYIWLGTEAGLVRYDGHKFRLFSKEEMGTDNTRISIIARQIHNGQLYAETETREQVSLRIHNNRPIFSPINPYINTLWARMQNGPRVYSSLFHHEDDYPSVEDKPSLVFITPDTFFLLTNAHVICRTYRQVVWEIDVAQKKEDHYYWHNNRIYQYSNDGVFWEITPQGLKHRLRIPRFKKLVWNLPEKQTFIHTSDRQLLLLEQDTNGLLVTRPFLYGLPPDLEINKAFHIKKELVFIGTVTHGLFIYRKQHFKTYGGGKPGFGSIYYALTNDGNSIITGKKTRVFLNGNMQTLTRDEDSNPHTTLAYWDSDSLLFIQQNRLVLYSDKQKRNLKTWQFAQKPLCLYVDPKGRTWVSCRYGALYLITRNLQCYPQFALRNRYYIGSMLLRNERLLLGTFKGLLEYDIRTRHIIRYTATAKMNIRQIYRSKAGYYYFCTYGDGIFVVNNYRPTLLPLDRSQYLKMAHCIIQDQRGQLWISSNKGLFLVPEREISLYLEGKISSVQYYYLNKENGFLSNEFNGGCQPCATRLPSGYIAFPNINGIVLFHPDSVHFYVPSGKLSVEKINLDGRFMKTITDTVYVKRNFAQLEIYLSTAFFGAFENLKIEYSTDHTPNRVWLPMHSNQMVSFSSLPSGYSHVYFRQKRRAGPGEYNYYTLVLYKPKAIWELPIFWGACMLALLSILLLAVRLRVRSLKQRNRKLATTVNTARRELIVTIESLTETTQKLEKKTRFQQWLTSSIVHDLRGPLRFIHFFNSDIRKDSDETTPAEAKFLKSVYFSALKIYNYSDNLVQLLRIEQTSDFPPQKTDFTKLAADKMEQFREQAAWNRVTLYMDPDSDSFIYVNGAALSIILQNLLDNSVKNGLNGHVYLSLKNTEHHSVIKLWDEGPGMSEEQIHKFNGDEPLETSLPS